MQRGGPIFGAHRCVVMYSVVVFSFSLLSVAPAVDGDALEDFAEVYIDQYFKPDARFLLNEQSKKKSQALAHYAMGRAFEAKGRVGEAVKSYRKVLENQPDQHFLARKTAYLLARQGSNDQALALLESNLESNPDEAYAYISLSEYLVTYQGNDPEGRARAFQIIEDAAERFPDETAVYDHLVKLLVSSSRKDEAREVIEKAASRDNSDPRYWLDIGKIAGRTWPPLTNGPSRDTELVNRIFGKAREFSGGDSEVVEQLGDFYHATRQFDDAVILYNDVIKEHPDRLDIREKLARVYAGMGDEENVIQTFKDIVEIDPQNAVVLKQIAGIYMRSEDYLKAVPYLKKSLAISKGSEAEYGVLGRMMIEAEEDEAAIEFLAGAAYLFPDSPEFPFLMTFSTSRLEQWKRATKHFKVALALGEEDRPEMFNETFFFRYAAAHERNGDLKIAEELFQKTIEMIAKKAPGEEDRQFTATVYNYLGYMWLENDMNIAEAGELIKTAADLDPESGAIADSLGWYYFKTKRYEEARDALLRAEEAMGEATAGEAEIFDHIGRVFHKLGEKEKAVEYLERAIELDPENSVILERLEDFRKTEQAKPKPDSPASSPENAKEAEKSGPKIGKKASQPVEAG